MRTYSVTILSVLLAMEALFIANAFGTWPLLLTVYCTALLCVAIRLFRSDRSETYSSESRWPRWLRWSVLCILHGSVFVVMVGLRMPAEFTQRINPIFVGADILAHTCLISSLVIWIVVPRQGHLAMLAHGLFIVMFSMLAGGVSQSMTSQTSVGLMTCFGYAMASQLIFGSRPSSSQNQTRHDSSNRWFAPVSTVLTIFILLVGTSAAANVGGSVLPNLQTRLLSQIGDSISSVTDHSLLSGMRYVDGSVLGQLRRHMLSEPESLALTVDCEETPGYLRGRAFDLYQNQRWIPAGTSDSIPFPDMQVIRERDLDASRTVDTKFARNLKHFDLAPPTQEELVEFAIRNVPSKGYMVFLPLEARWIQGRSGGITVSPNGIVQQGIDAKIPYIAGVGRSPIARELNPSHRRILLRLPRRVQSTVNRVANEVFKDARTTPQKIAAASQFFQSKFQYSLDTVECPSGMDPVVFFLNSRHPAHCEYFATAACLLLRSSGVPARYVTGYIVDEATDDDGRWIARSRDAHGWVEAYDDQSGHWLPVEATPGRTYQSIQEEDLTLASSSGLNAEADDVAGQEPLYQQVWDWLTATRYTSVVLTLFRVLAIPVVVGLSYFLWTRQIRSSNSSLDPQDRESLKMLRRADRILRRQSLVRSPGETLHQFADRIERIDPGMVENSGVNRPSFSDGRAQRMDRIAAWYRQYADARYQGRLPDPLPQS